MSDVGHCSPHTASFTIVYWHSLNDVTVPTVFGTRSS